MVRRLRIREMCGRKYSVPCGKHGHSEDSAKVRQTRLAAHVTEGPAVVSVKWSTRHLTRSRTSYPYCHRLQQPSRTVHRSAVPCTGRASEGGPLPRYGTGSRSRTSACYLPLVRMPAPRMHRVNRHGHSICPVLFVQFHHLPRPMIPVVHLVGFA